MSGSRGEANFVWKCKMCKVSTMKSSPIEWLIMLHRENPQLPSSHLPSPTPKHHRQLAKRSLSLTAEDLSLWISSQRYVSFIQELV